MAIPDQSVPTPQPAPPGAVTTWTSGMVVVSLTPQTALTTMSRADDGWTAQGPAAFVLRGRRALVYCDATRADRPWHAALLGAAVGRLDPRFLTDHRQRIRDFTSADEARAACEAALGTGG